MQHTEYSVAAVDRSYRFVKLSGDDDDPFELAFDPRSVTAYSAYRSRLKGPDRFALTMYLRDHTFSLLFDDEETFRSVVRELDGGLLPHEQPGGVLEP